MRDLENPLRWFVRPLLQFVFAVLLHLTWAFKRLPLPQFRAHGLLQWTICGVLPRHSSSPEANHADPAALRHRIEHPEFPAGQQPRRQTCAAHAVSRAAWMTCARQTFVDHDQELFRMIRDLGVMAAAIASRHLPRPADLDVDPLAGQVDIRDQGHPQRFTQVLDFETSHALFMCLFCLLLTRDEYRDAINGFNLDQSMAIRVGAADRRPDRGGTGLQQIPAIHGRAVEPGPAVPDAWILHGVPARAARGVSRRRSSPRPASPAAPARCPLTTYL